MRPHLILPGRRIARAGGAGDANTTFLCSPNDADASTSFVDLSSYAHTITANGNAQMDDAQYKTRALSALFDGTGDYLSVADNADMEIGGASAIDFTIDFWVRFNALPAFAGFMQLVRKGSSYAPINITAYNGGAGTNILLYMSSTGVSWNVVNGSTIKSSVSTGVWYHIAVEYDGSNINAYADGVKSLSPAYTGALLNNTNSWTWADSGAGSSLNGWMDEIRHSDIARYGGSNFTPETGPY